MQLVLADIRQEQRIARQRLTPIIGDQLLVFLRDQRQIRFFGLPPVISHHVGS